MVKLLALAGAWLALASAAPGYDPVDSRAVALVQCSDGARGTAFWIGRERIVSAAHVVAGRTCAIAGAPLAPVRLDGGKDIAELRGPVSDHVLPYRCSGFRAFGLYRAVGYARGLHRVTLPETAMPWRSHDNGANGLNVLSGQVEPGMSGGPVLDRRGRVVGIVNQHSPARSRSLSETFICGRN